MSAARLQELPYRGDSETRFEAIAREPWAVFLDSCHTWSQQGRYDLVAAAPSVTLVTRGEVTEIRTRDGVHRSRRDPFALVRRYLGQRLRPLGGLPFPGGAIGFFGYDLARRIERLPRLAAPVPEVPDMALGIYDWALVVDHLRRRSWLVAADRDPATARRWARLIAIFSAPRAAAGGGVFRVSGEPRVDLDRAAYAAGFRRIQRYIRDGHCYQVNFARNFSVPAHGDAWAAYRLLRRMNPAPFSAWLDIPGVRVLSSSPERFLRLRGREVETCPIKGTRPRGRSPEQDRALAAALSASAKDRAENLMIVDLLRNDLGRTCVPGSIRVPKLFAVESFATVHHLVSTVRGRLAATEDALSLLRGCFPGGSITGAPKIRAMEIIEELESRRRGVYCGAIGYLGFDGGMDTNIAIRTLIHTDRELSFGVGGGIVADSRLEDEYRETGTKAEALLRLIDSLRGH